MSGGPLARLRRLAADLGRAETRGAAVARVRRRALSGLRGATGREHADAPGPDVAPDALEQAARRRAEATLAQAIATGLPLEQAVARTVHALADVDEHAAAWSVAEGAGRLPGGGDASRIGHAVRHHRRRQLQRSWNVARTLDDGALARHIPVEAVDGALATGGDDARRRAINIGRPSAELAPAALVDLAGRFLAMGERPAAAALAAELRARPVPELDDARRASWSLIERWLDPQPVDVPAGAVPVGILDYGTPDPAGSSPNLGDSIQTLALLGNLVRFTEVAFSGEGGLGEVATDLASRVREDLRVGGASGAVHLVPVTRDFSSQEPVPGDTWTIAFGWHMGPLYDLRHDFPYHPNIRPLFLSFHVNHLDMLTAEALEYLRRHGPVGCRDWNTVFLLLSAGVDAFFSGCLTTTVDALYPRRADVYSGKGSVGVIDVPRRSAVGADNGSTYSHHSDGNRPMSMAERLGASDAILAAYQRDLSRAVTGRLRAFLALTSLGVPAELRTWAPGDVRFAGLSDLTVGDAKLATMQAGIRDLIAETFRTILDGASPDDVYARWRDLTAARVAEARARFELPVADPGTTIDAPAAVADSLAGSLRFGPHGGVDPEAVTDVVLAYDQNLELPAAVLIESMLAHASGPVRLWILARGLSQAYQEWLAAAFPALPMTFIPCDRISYVSAGRPRRLPPRITISTMDRLVLPLMLPDVRRVVYVDVDTLMLGDVCELARTDLGGHPVAAVDSNVSEAAGWQRAARHLPEPQATELRRRNALLHGFAGKALNAGVLVMDLERMRADDFTARYLGWAEAYGSHDQDTMLAYVGPNRARLDPSWNAMPIIEDVTDPKIIHWAAFSKPWEPELTYEQARWQAVAARVCDRAGLPPPTPS